MEKYQKILYFRSSETFKYFVGSFWCKILLKQVTIIFLIILELFDILWVYYGKLNQIFMPFNHIKQIKCWKISGLKLNLWFDFFNPMNRGLLKIDVCICDTNNSYGVAISISFLIMLISFNSSGKTFWDYKALTLPII